MTCGIAGAAAHHIGAAIGPGRKVAAQRPVVCARRVRPCLARSPRRAVPVEAGRCILYAYGDGDDTGGRIASGARDAGNGAIYLIMDRRCDDGGGRRGVHRNRVGLAREGDGKRVDDLELQEVIGGRIGERKAGHGEELGGADRAGDGEARGAPIAPGSAAVEGEAVGRGERLKPGRVAHANR